MNNTTQRAEEASDGTKLDSSTVIANPDTKPYEFYENRSTTGGKRRSRRSRRSKKSKRHTYR
jgi:hypothetical protein